MSAQLCSILLPLHAVREVIICASTWCSLQFSTRDRQGKVHSYFKKWFFIIVPIKVQQPRNQFSFSPTFYVSRACRRHMVIPFTRHDADNVSVDTSRSSVLVTLAALSVEN
jgi:hypothetical protein